MMLPFAPIICFWPATRCPQSTRLPGFRKHAAALGACKGRSVTAISG
jgi:hypothetical protein